MKVKNPVTTICLGSRIALGAVLRGCDESGLNNHGLMLSATRHNPGVGTDRHALASLRLLSKALGDAERHGLWVVGGFGLPKPRSGTPAVAVKVGAVYTIGTRRLRDGSQREVGRDLRPPSEGLG